jgi:hypothetical protein
MPDELLPSGHGDTVDPPRRRQVCAHLLHISSPLTCLVLRGLGRVRVRESREHKSREMMCKSEDPREERARLAPLWSCPVGCLARELPARVHFWGTGHRVDPSKNMAGYMCAVVAHIFTICMHWLHFFGREDFVPRCSFLGSIACFPDFVAMILPLSHMVCARAHALRGGPCLGSLSLAHFYPSPCVAFVRAHGDI